MTADSAAASTQEPSCPWGTRPRGLSRRPWNPARRVWKSRAAQGRSIPGPRAGRLRSCTSTKEPSVPFGTLSGGEPLSGFRPRRRPRRATCPWNPTRLLCLGCAAQRRAAQEPAPVLDPPRATMPLGTACRWHAGVMASGTDKRTGNKTVTRPAHRPEERRRPRTRPTSGPATLSLPCFGRPPSAAAGPRARRRPPADHVALRKLLGECGRVGNNINQIARRLNADGPLDIPELRATLAAYLDIRAAILRALAMETTGENAAPAMAPDDH